MRKSVRRILRGLAALVFVLVVVAVALFVWIWRGGRPQRHGEVRLTGLSAAVEVRFDGTGAPAIRAATPRDAFAALGWLHANDRLFQMEISRRAAAGRLAEIFGARAAGFDARMRRLRFRVLSEAALAASPATTRAAVEAYATGVNAWLARRGGDLPPEFRILRHRPEPWTGADTIAINYMMSRELSPVDEPNEEEAFTLLRAFGSEKARALLGAPDARIFDEIVDLARALTPAPAEIWARSESAGLGSNNWVVGPHRTASGHALLANDPHLGLELPNVWYRATVRAPGYEATGMTLPGTPLVVLGRGARIAWGFTNLYVDDVDLFFERLDETGTKVLRGESWLPIEITKVTVRVKDGAPIEVEVKSTDRGTFLDADPAAGLPARSVAWTAHTAADQFGPMRDLAGLDSVEQVPAAIASWGFPAQNLVAADASGHILWTPIGRAPARFGWDGKFPAPGWSPEVGWSGLIPEAKNPVLEDPPDGLVATANSFLPVPLPAWFGGEFDTPFRADRIRQRLAERRDWTVESLSGIQQDATSLWARAVVAALGGTYAGDAGQAAAMLRAWDGTMAGAGAPALYGLFERALLRAAFDDEARKAEIARFGTRWRLLRLLSGEVGAEFWDDVATPDAEAKHAIVERALLEAWRAARERFGEDPADWRWEALHRLTLDHTLSGLPVMGGLFDRGPFEVPGSATTVLAFGGPWRDGFQDVVYGPSMRFVTDAANPDDTVAILPGGQSGHPGDRHYADQIHDYLDGRARPVPWSEAGIERATVERLRLVP